MLTYIALFIIGMGITYITLPLIIKASFYLGAIDYPGERKIHTTPIPRMGGLSISLAFYIGICALFTWPNLISESFFKEETRVIGLIIGSVIIICLGLYDDIHGANAYKKLTSQIIAACVVCCFGSVWRSTGIPYFGTIEFGILAYPLTIFWIISITNAFNLIDGVDGLAAGVALFVCAGNFFIALSTNNTSMAVVTLILGGGLLVFLKYNFHPASVFLGDTGSMFLGFVLAVVSLQTAMKGSTLTFALVPVCALGYPILDVLFAIVRRTIQGKPLFSADLGHIHHRLLNKGFGHRGTVALIYIFTIIFTLLGFFVLYQRYVAIAVTSTIVMIVIGVGFHSLGYKEYITSAKTQNYRSLYQIRNLCKQVAILKLGLAENLDDIWKILCWLAEEFGYSRIIMELQGDIREWSRENYIHPDNNTYNYLKINMEKTGGGIICEYSLIYNQYLHIDQNILFSCVVKEIDLSLQHFPMIKRNADIVTRNVG